MLRNIKKIGARFTLLNNRKANLTGFTLIELIVVITIIAVLSTIVLITFRTGQEQFALQRSAHILAQDIRRAQELAMRAEEFHGIVPRGGFGIYLNLNRVVGTYPHLTSYYILFADCNENRSYDGDATICRSLTPGVYFSEQIERREIERGVRITEISTLSPTTIVFIPPDPAIRIRSGGADFTNTIITLSIGNLSERVTVNSAGLIEIGVAPPPLPITPLISVTPASHDFGSVNINTSADRIFAVSNTGGGTLSGTASVPAPFSCIAGCSYSLGAGASQNITIRFTPTAEGFISRTVSFTGAAGASRTVSGTGVVPAPVISVTPASHDFGSVTIGSVADRTFTVSNTGGGTLSGTASVPAPFSCIAGCSYSLGAGAFQNVTIRFAPTTAGFISQLVSFTGGGGASRTVSGTGVAPAPAISVTPASHDFGSITVNTSADRTFTVSNTGGGTLSGTASVPAPFSCIAGCSYSLGAGAFQNVTIRFAPTTAGFISRTVSFTGAAGASRTVSGTGVAPAPGRVFLTSTLHTGNLGGLSGADSICQTRANVAGLGGIWRALLSTSTVNARDRIPDKQYNSLDGFLIANNRADLWDGTLHSPIVLDEFGHFRNFTFVWTGTRSDGTAHEHTSNDWTTSGPMGRVGLNDRTDLLWVDIDSHHSDFGRNLFCFSI